MCTQPGWAGPRAAAEPRSAATLDVEDTVPMRPRAPPPRGPLQWPHRHRWAAPGHSGSRFGAWGRTDGVTRAGQFPSGQMGCFLISVPLQDSGKWRKKENQQQAPRTLCHTQLLARRGFWGSPYPTTPAHHAQQPTSSHQASSSRPLTPVSTPGGRAESRLPRVAGTGSAPPALCTSLPSAPAEDTRAWAPSLSPQLPPGSLTSQAVQQMKARVSRAWGLGVVALTKLPQAHFRCQVPGRAVCGVPDPTTGTTARGGLPCL